MATNDEQTMPDGTSVDAFRDQLTKVANAAFGGGIPAGWKILGFSYSEDWEYSDSEYDPDLDTMVPEGQKGKRPEMARVRLQSVGNFPGMSEPVVFGAERREKTGVRVKDMQVGKPDEKGVGFYW